MHSHIHSIRGREIFDSRGVPTIQVDVKLADGSWGQSAAPSGASKGEHEAHELRDGDSERFKGRGVLRAVAHVNEILAPALQGMDALQQKIIDTRMIELDGTPNKSRLGGNAIVAVSLASARAAANHKRLPLFQYLGGPDANRLPVPMMNILNGGKHAHNKNLGIQEFMIVPAGFDRFQDALRCGVEIFMVLKELLKAKGFSINVGDEGGFAPDLATNEMALSLIEEAVDRSRYQLQEHVWLALDVAASELYGKERAGHYRIEGELLPSEGMVDLLEKWANAYPICSIEDGCAEDDWDGWTMLTDRLGDSVQIVGDDLFVTDWKRLQRGIERRAANCCLIKPNQIGTLTETIKTIEHARQSRYRTVMSHRSGETEDTTISDLAVGLQTGQIKTGSASRSERMAKYNRLLQIEEMLGGSAQFGDRPGGSS